LYRRRAFYAERKNDCTGEKSRINKGSVESLQGAFGKSKNNDQSSQAWFVVARVEAEKE